LTNTEKEHVDLQRHYREYLVFKRASAVIITVAVLAILFSGFYLYNLINTLVNECPKHHHMHMQDVESYNPSTIQLYLSYDHTPKNEYYKKTNVLILKYNITSKEIIRKVKKTNPNENDYDRWYKENTILSYEQVNTMNNRQNSQTLTQSPTTKVEEQNTDQYFCMNKNNVLYSFLENEISRELDKNLKERLDMKSFRIMDKHNPYAHSNDENEQDVTFHMMTKTICRNEFAFSIVTIIFLLLWDLITLALISYNIYLIRS